ncbi:hypothetical protein C8R46DRAFT_1027901 [Mycena filopes]|nr:hypothetical protein C8R46DRAFT_1027901 [Mycena filopes]
MRRTASFRDIEEPASRPTRYTHGVLSRSTLASVACRWPTLLLLGLSVVFLPAALIFLVVSHHYRGLVTILELTTQQEASLPGAVVVLNGYYSFLLLLAVDTLFPQIIGLGQLLDWAEFRYRRGHSSQIRADRFQQLIDDGTITIFVQGASRRSVPILVSKYSTVAYILRTLQRRNLIPSNWRSSHRLYLPGRLAALEGRTTIEDLNLTSYSHLDIRVLVPGGAQIPPEWDQHALDENGNLKDAADMEWDVWQI